MDATVNEIITKETKDGNSVLGARSLLLCGSLSM